MASPNASTPSKPNFYALVNYEDPYVQPLILSALRTRLPPSSYHLISALSFLPSKSSPVLQFLQYESIDFDHLLSHPTTSLSNAYIIRKALIRKHYLSTTVSNWITKYPESVLRQCVKPSVEFEVDYAEFLDDALVEAWELRESWGRNEKLDLEGGGEEKEKEWWILKPGMSERGQGIRLFGSEEELVRIFEEWDPESDDDVEDEDEDNADTDTGARSDQHTQETKTRTTEKHEGNGIITSQLRHFIAQPYIHPPLLLSPRSSSSSSISTTLPRKFHIRTYVLAVGALKIYVYKPMLALFAARPYMPPWESANDDESLRAHLTNTCLQDTSEREGSVELFWSLPDSLTTSNSNTNTLPNSSWKSAIFSQICAITSETFLAAARSMSIHFQPLPNAFEIFGVDFLVGVEGDGRLNTYLLEVNAFPDFRQTGTELKGLVEGLFEGVVDVGVRPFFEVEGEGKAVGEEEEKMVRVLDVDLGRR
ncbi:TTL-domain-containing protein [Lindgomyces ingoldianus]|uniref:TTL-domain-containing protein n=1 Tax=Lindgomyces ingoldianus TaxID=673940 RepID=A0ACB6QCP1_9PLEO|nr:TTL-domain-containing protein [Lindgomyces ingoldianus]KAF2464718.1 TTL-domain-containing protein [Lindgomyces ingoldianus]